MEKLTKQEEEVMQLIWQLDTCTVKEIIDKMSEPKPPYTTIASVISNLKRKSYVALSRRGNAYVYTPVIKEADYKRTFMSGFVHDYFKNSFKEMVSFFAREEKLSPEDLQDIIKQIEDGNK